MAEQQESITVGRYKAVHDGDAWRVMEAFGAHRMLKNRFKTSTSAVKRARLMAARG